MIVIPSAPDYHEQLERHGMREALPCLVCGRAVKRRAAAVVRVFWGTHICLRAHPEIAPYVKRELDANSRSLTTLS